MASFSKVDCGDTIPFTHLGADSTGAPDGDNEGVDMAGAGVPKVWPDGSVSDGGFNSVAPKAMSIASGHDTYQGIPGDGIVGGNPGADHSVPATWGVTASVVAEGNAGVAAVPGGGE